MPDARVAPTPASSALSWPADRGEHGCEHRGLGLGFHPDASWLGIGLAAFTAPTMPLLAGAKRRLGNQLHSAATIKEASQTQLCAYLSIALLVGLVQTRSPADGGPIH
jgi:divalent metal cation (Fe/Co/Zn/Cd) transporter